MTQMNEDRATALRGWAKGSTTMELADSRLAELRQQLADEERAQRQREAKVQREFALIQKAAGKSHSRVVLDLYDLLGVPPEHPRQRVIDADGEQRTVSVSTDKDEQLRTQRLYHLVQLLILEVTEDRLAALRDADAAGLDVRRSERLAGRKKA